MFGRLLRRPAWQWRGHILVLALYKFHLGLLVSLDTYPLTYSPGTYKGAQTPGETQNLLNNHCVCWYDRP